MDRFSVKSGPVESANHDDDDDDDEDGSGAFLPFVIGRRDVDLGIQMLY